jgi:SNF2 family DNA or RNA helicase
MVAAEIDKNPFLIFDLNDCSLADLKTGADLTIMPQKQKIKTVQECFPHAKMTQENETYQFKPALLAAIDFSKIPALGDFVTKLLSDKPLFYDKNFKYFVHQEYIFWSRTAKSDTESLTAAQLDSEAFSQQWPQAEEWLQATIIVDEFHHCIAIKNHTKSAFKVTKKRLIRTLIHFLCAVPTSFLHQLSPHLQVLHAIHRYVYLLIQGGSFIPEIMQYDENYVFIRWLPAFCNTIIENIYHQLSTVCPPDLVVYSTNKKITYGTAKDQIASACSLMIAHYIHEAHSDAVEDHADDPIQQLFFYGIPQKFDEFHTKETPSLVTEWLSCFNNLSLVHAFCIVVSEHNDKFKIQLKIATDTTKATLMSIEEFCNARSNAHVSHAALVMFNLLSQYEPNFKKLTTDTASFSIHMRDFGDYLLYTVPFFAQLGVSILLPKSLQHLAKPRLRLNLRAKKSLKPTRESFLNLGNLLDFEWKIAIGKQQIDPKAFKKMYGNARGLVRIKDHYVLLDIGNIARLMKRIDTLPERLENIELLQAMLVNDTGEYEIQVNAHVEQFLKAMREYKPAIVPSNLQATLRPYQRRGFSWLVQNIETGFGSIIADDMGLGKTIQVIASILHCKNSGLLQDQKILVVCPTGLLSNWRKEIERFAPSLKTLIYHGIQRSLPQKNYDIVLTSYGLARRDEVVLSKKEWFLVVIDEAQNIKNPVTAQTKAIKNLPARHKIAMSGTPVENRMLEYWSIFDFTNKNYLGSVRSFNTNFAKPIEQNRDQDCLERFRKITSLFILRRLKIDKTIISDLPDKIENDLYCNLTPEQAALYQGIVDATLETIKNSEGIERKGLIFKLLTSLKQVCNHPAQYSKLKKAAISASGKMQLLEELLIGIHELTEKTLIFTQYVEMGNLLAGALEERFKHAIPFLHGGLTPKVRDQIVHRFQTEPHTRTLLVSLKAGGVGLNLTAATHVVHYDLWWNPAVESQATDRAYRIGQNRKVTVYRLLTSNTFEERINDMIQRKKELANLTVANGEHWITEMTNDQLRELVTMTKEL